MLSLGMISFCTYQFLHFLPVFSLTSAVLGPVPVAELLQDLRKLFPEEGIRHTLPAQLPAEVLWIDGVRYRASVDQSDEEC